MLDRLRSAFSEAVRNFHEELNREVPEPGRSGDSVEQSRLLDLERTIAEATHEAEAESDLEATCLRRAALAEDVGDRETAEIARAFAARHRTRAELLREKIAILSRELEHRTSPPEIVPVAPLNGTEQARGGTHPGSTVD